ncbi:MAG: glycosyl hydrolase, repeat-containing protein [Acidobacteria bacterium]|nr:glycosyl hydrolase, repeat-containing protein [Acidobacteriota bacterium]
MTRKTQIIVIAILAIIVPVTIVTSSRANRNANTAARRSPGLNSGGLTTKLPISSGAQLSAMLGGASQQSKPELSYSQRMHKGKDEAAMYPDDISQMSSMGRLAYLVARARAEKPDGGKGTGFRINGGGCLSDDPDCENEGGVGLNDKQSEMAIAVDPSGQHVVVGFNESQGFATNPLKLSGFATSHDGGVTFLPANIGVMPSPADKSIGATLYPQIFGDPDIKWVAAPSTPNGGVFVYASIMVTTIAGPGGTGTVQTLSMHRSLDFGNTWQGPFEVTPASNPNGAFSGNNARDASDKELIDVDPDTNRLMVTWSNFTSATFSPVGKQMFTTFSDDIATAVTPTWSARQNVNLASTIPGQGAIPRFAGNGSPNVYVAYQSQTTGLAAQEFFARSTDNGVSFSPAVALTAGTFKVMDLVLGNDRSHDFPWMAVDNSPVVATRGNIYIVYADNTLNDGSDIVFQRSIDGGLNFTPPVQLNARPGQDRPQWFPVVTVDTTSGRVWVFYYDQGVADTGDTMETSAVYSDDGGVTWSKQVSLSDRPFHAGYGNDTGQPNLGDYNAGVSQGGVLYSTFAYNPDVVLFTDGQPAATFPAIDFFLKTTSETPARAALEIRNHPRGGVAMLEKPLTLTGEITVPLTNGTTNPLDTPLTYTGVTATLTTSTPNVSVTTGNSAYPDIAAGATQNNTTTFIVQFAGGFVFGTKVDFTLNVTTAQGNRTLLFTVNSGNTPTLTSLLTENFDAAVAPALPAGWTASHGGGATTVPWKTDNHKPKDNSIVSQGLFHANANDGANPTRFERAFSPLFVVPAASTYVSVDFDITYDTEDDPSFVYQAYDGALLRITDQTAGRTLRSVLTETFAELQQTGNTLHYPKHFPRNSSASYFEDMSAWAGDSSVVPGNNSGVLHVHMLFPGMGGSTAQLRFEFAQDSNGICTDIRPSDTNCGVLVDNVVVRNITYNAPTAADTTISGQVVTPEGQPAAGVVMQLSGARSDRTITDSRGFYTFRHITTGQFYTVTPSLLTYHFSPGQRSFSVLANVTDATFTAAQDAVVLGNVIDSPEYFVRQHYLDFLNREPDQSGFNFWSDQMLECGNDRACLERRTIDVSAAFFISGEFQQTGSYIYRLYKGALGRQLSFAEFSQDRQQLISGETLERTRERYVEQFVERPEFLERYGATSSAESYVDTLLQTILQSSGVDLTSERGRLIDKYNLIYDRREKRPEVLKDVIEAAAFKQAVYNPSFVLMEYFGYLRRNPDTQGYNFWLNVLNNDASNYRGMVCSFITSAEYQHRFGSVVSHSNRDCAGVQ